DGHGTNRTGDGVAACCDGGRSLYTYRGRDTAHLLAARRRWRRPHTAAPRDATTVRLDTPARTDPHGTRRTGAAVGGLADGAVDTDLPGPRRLSPLECLATDVRRVGDHRPDWHRRRSRIRHCAVDAQPAGDRNARRFPRRGNPSNLHLGGRNWH